MFDNDLLLLCPIPLRWWEISSYPERGKSEMRFQR